MVTLDKIYTRGGDSGKTSLAGGKRVSKHDLRIEAYGTLDEANSFIGVARLYVDLKTDFELKHIQNDLFDLGADLCTPEGTERRNGALRITKKQVQRLENEIDAMNKKLKPLSSFILPGGSPAGAYLHLSRTTVRRCERLLTELAEREALNSECIKYVNRLSDHLFQLSRHVNDDGDLDILWVPGKNF